MNLFTPNTDVIEDFYEKRKFTLAWRLSLLLCFSFIILAITFINNKIEILGTYSVCVAITLISLTYLVIKKKSKIVYYFFSIIGTLIVTYTLNYFHNVIHYGDFLWIILIITLSFFGLGTKLGILFLILNSLNILFYALFTVNLNLANVNFLSYSERIGLAIELVVATISISYVIYEFVVFHNYSYSNLKEQNIIISNQNNEKTMLVKEIHHRVKNNLQIIISLLRLQKGELKSEEAKQHFNEAINRIMTMSLIHKKLYEQTDLAQIEIKPYLTDLSYDVIHISDMGKPIKFNISSEIERIGLKTIVPLGLLINELLSNSIKHAFQKEKDGFIDINIYKNKNNGFKLIYSDSGNWLAPPKDYTGFGLGLIETLVEQLEGDFTRNESEYIFTIKNLDFVINT